MTEIKNLLSQLQLAADSKPIAEEFATDIEESERIARNLLDYAMDDVATDNVPNTHAEGLASECSTAADLIRMLARHAARLSASKLESSESGMPSVITAASRAASRAEWRLRRAAEFISAIGSVMSPISDESQKRAAVAGYRRLFG